MYLVSACLLGDKCKYNGKSNYNKKVLEICESNFCIKVCPEVMGGLSTPRTPAERIGDKVISKEGEDFTENFIIGAEETLSIAKEFGIKKAILKSRSPSCGYGEIYDGSFSNILIEGNGLTAELLSKNGIDILTEEDIEEE